MSDTLTRFLSLSLSALCFFAAPLAAEQSDLLKIRSSLATGDRPVKIVCFGDSVTGVYYHTGGRRAYTDMLGIALQQIHPNAEVQMVNAGISGHTTANALARIERDVLSHKPDLVTVMFGLNDVAKLPIADYRKNLLAIVDRCRTANATVILCTPNAVVTTADRPVETLEKYCDVMREVADERKVLLCDTYAHFLSLGETDPDSWRATLSGEIHPNMAGHKIIAEQQAHTISGKSTSLADTRPPALALRKTLVLIKEGKPLSVLAMPPFDKMIDDSLREFFPDADLKITSWPINGLSMSQLRKDASQRVRQMKPDLVLVAVPRNVTAKDRAEFFDEQAWIVNYSQSFGKQEWDIVVIHPSVAEPTSKASPRDPWIRSITMAQDIGLVDRSAGDQRSASEVFSEWIQSQVATL